MTPDPVLAAALRELEYLEGWHAHQVYEDGSDGTDHLYPIRQALEAAIARSAHPEGLEERGDMTTPCQADAFCYRSDGHGGDHAYALHSKDTGS